MSELASKHCSRCKRQLRSETDVLRDERCNACNHKMELYEREFNHRKTEFWTRQPRSVVARSSSEDLTFLRNISLKFSESAPKLEYASWLIENGEVNKGSFLEKLVIAYSSLSESDLPDIESVDRCWSRMVGGHTLESVIRVSSHLDMPDRLHLRDVVFRYLQPSIVVRYCDIEDVPYNDFQPVALTSHYFGDPELSDGIAWPTYRDCLHDFEDSEGVIPLDSPCLFACQVRTKDFSACVAGDLADADEILSFFTFVETDRVGTQSICLVAQNDLSGLQVRRQPQNALGSNATIGARPLYFLEELTLPSSYESTIPEIRDLDERIEQGTRLYDIVASASRIERDLRWKDLQLFVRSEDSIEPVPLNVTISVRCSLDAGTIHLAIDRNAIRLRRWEEVRLAGADWDG